METEKQRPQTDKDLGDGDRQRNRDLRQTKTSVMETEKQRPQTDIDLGDGDRQRNRDLRQTKTSVMETEKQTSDRQRPR